MMVSRMVAPPCCGGAALTLSMAFLCGVTGLAARGTSGNPGPRLPTVLFVGDSVSAGVGDAGPGQSFPAIIAGIGAREMAFKVATVARAGWGLAELASGIHQHIEGAPELVVVQGGLNDLLRSREPALVEVDLEELLCEAARHTPMIVVVSLPDAPGLPSRPQQELRAITDRVAGRLGVAVVRITLAEPIHDMLSADRIHPGKPGHALIAQMLLPYVRRATAGNSR